MNNSIKRLKEQFSFNHLPSIVSLKKRLKLISKLSGQPLMTVQERVCSMFGYSSWYNFQNIHSEYVKPNSGKPFLRKDVILSKEEPTRKGVEREYFNLASHALLDENLWITEKMLRLHTEVHLSRDETHTMFVNLISRFYEQTEKMDFPNVMLIDPSRKEIGDWIALKTDFMKYPFLSSESIYLDFSEEQELKNSFFTSNVKKLIFPSKQSLLKIFLSSYCVDLIKEIPNMGVDSSMEDIDMMDFVMVRNYLTNFSEFTEQNILSELMQRYEKLMNKPFMVKNINDTYNAINVDSLQNFAGSVVAYFGENKNSDDYLFFENLRLLSLYTCARVKRVHFFYSERAVLDFISRGRGVMCFIKSDEKSLISSGNCGSSIFKASLLNNCIDDSLLFYRSNTSSIPYNIPISEINNKHLIDEKIISKINKLKSEN